MTEKEKQFQIYSVGYEMTKKYKELSEQIEQMENLIFKAVSCSD